MTISEHISRDRESALRSGDHLKLSVLRLLAAAIHNREIEVRSTTGVLAPLSDEDVIQTIRQEFKKRTDAIAAYDHGGRPDASERERREAEILKSYLPAELSDDELKAIVDEGVRVLGVSSQKDYGKLMGWVMAQVGQQASGDRVRAIAKRVVPEA